jgi:hypothetical protein
MRERATAPYNGPEPPRGALYVILGGAKFMLAPAGVILGPNDEPAPINDVPVGSTDLLPISP